MKRVLIIAAASIAVSASAQHTITGPGSYFQDFNTLNMTGTGWAWNDNLPAAGMQGWYSNAAIYHADNGSMVLPGQYSFGPNNSSERALGSNAPPGALIVYGMRLANGSGSTIGSLNIDYTGEQWRSGTALTDVLQFEYSTNATSILSGTWNPVTALDFNSPNNTGAFAINGNLAANQAFLTSTITGLNFVNGSEMWIRWKHVGNASRHGMAIDDVHLKAGIVPEPGTVAALALACMGMITSRRRRMG